MIIVLPTSRCSRLNSARMLLRSSASKEAESAHPAGKPAAGGRAPAPVLSAAARLQRRSPASGADVLDAEQFGDLEDAPFDLDFRAPPRAAGTQRSRTPSVRVEREVIEDHCQVALRSVDLSHQRPSMIRRRRSV